SIFHARSEDSHRNGIQARGRRERDGSEREASMTRGGISPLCFGCEPLGGTDWGTVDIAGIERAIGRALELGIDFFDTADVYGLGLSEERLSHALGHRRHDVTIATKGGVS